MTFCYQTQCQEPCYAPCGYGTVYSYRSYDCGSPCGFRGYGSVCGYRDWCPSYSSRYSLPSSCYSGRYGYGSCYPCYRC